ncbi:hypothetical protein BASA81_003780 [Batrachochytrium salamandrivorans]|nr:hypothetical protein BASA81_003780 [Batrachochytrium salamandrivorans]
MLLALVALAAWGGRAEQEPDLVRLTTFSLVHNPAALGFFEKLENPLPDCPLELPVACAAGSSSKKSRAKCCPLEIDGSRDPNVCLTTNNKKCVKQGPKKHRKEQARASPWEVVFFLFSLLLLLIVLFGY